MIRVREKLEDAPLVEEGTMSPRMQVETLQAEKGKEMEPFLNPQREQDFACFKSFLDLSPMQLMSDSDL